MGNSSHHDCHQPGCTVQVSWSTNSCYCPDHRAGREDPKIWDGTDHSRDDPDRVQVPLDIDADLFRRFTSYIRVWKPNVPTNTVIIQLIEDFLP